MKNILFLCTGNSARSIMAECYLNHAGKDRWLGWSAGSKPTGTPNPFSLTTLSDNEIIAISGDGGFPRSKSWDEFGAANAPIMDVVVTVCDNAAGEVCPIWPTGTNGKAPEKLHWSFPDPAAATGSDEDKRAAFQKIFTDIRAKIDAFLADQE